MRGQRISLIRVTAPEESKPQAADAEEHDTMGEKTSAGASESASRGHAEGERA